MYVFEFYDFFQITLLFQYFIIYSIISRSMSDTLLNFFKYRETN